MCGYYTLLIPLREMTKGIYLWGEIAIMFNSTIEPPRHRTQNI
jgi:hypothetical protein